PSTPHHPPLLPFPTRRSSDLIAWLLRTGSDIGCGSHSIPYPHPSISAAPWTKSLTRAEISMRVSTPKERTYNSIVASAGITEGRYPPSVIIACKRSLGGDRKSTRLNSSHVSISYAVFCLKKKKQERDEKEIK